MPRFFFRLRDGERSYQMKWRRIRDLSDAHGEAVKLAKCARQDMGEIGETSYCQAVKICDAHGILGDTVTFTQVSVNKVVFARPE